MKKLYYSIMVALTATIMLTSNAYARDVEITLDHALNLAISEMLAVQDLDDVIRTMRMQERDLRDQLRRLERGDAGNEAMNALGGALLELDMAIAMAGTAQQGISQQIDASLQAVVDSALASLPVDGHVQAMMAGLTSSQTLNTQIAGMQSQRNTIINEMNSLNNMLRGSIDDLRLAVNEIERQIENLRLHQEIIEVSMDYALRNILVILYEIDMGIEILELNMELADDRLHHATASYQVGFISTNDLLAIEHGILQGQTQLADLKRSRETIIQNINHMLGMPFSQNTIITFDIDIPETPEITNRHIERQIADTQTIRQLQFAVDSAKAERRAYTGNDRDIFISASDRRRALEPAGNDTNIRSIRERIALQDAVDRAIQERNTAIRTMEFTIRQAYRDLDALSSQLDAQHRNLSQAQTSFNTAYANYSVGRITLLELEQARIAVTTAEQGIERIYNQKWLLAFTLANPILL